MSNAEGEFVYNEDQSAPNDDHPASDDDQSASDDDRSELPKGARSLCRVALECTADAMLSEPNSYDLISTLPWKLQQDLWKRLLDDRRERRQLEEELATKRTHLIDWEACNDVDRNYDFIQAHPEDFLQGYVKEGDDSWSKFLNMALGSSFPDLPFNWVDWDKVFVGESATDSLNRFKCCRRWTDLEVDQIISADLMKARMAALQDAPNCDKYEERKDGSRSLSIRGVLLVEIEVDTTNSDDPEPNYVKCMIPRNGDRKRFGELYLNALLSPIDLGASVDFGINSSGSNISGRNAFARRALKSLGYGEHEGASEEAWEAHKSWEHWGY
jgi:hypothetical protein